MKQPELTNIRKSPRFNLGQIYFTPGIIELIDRLQIDPFQLLYRHACGDFGDVCKEDAQSNEHAIRYGTRILSAYKLDIDASTEQAVKVWLITEADRSVTTMLLPSEY